MKYAIVAATALLLCCDATEKQPGSNQTAPGDTRDSVTSSAPAGASVSFACCSTWPGPQVGDIVQGQGPQDCPFALGCGCEDGSFTSFFGFAADLAQGGPPPAGTPPQFSLGANMDLSGVRILVTNVGPGCISKTGRELLQVDGTVQ